MRLLRVFLLALAALSGTACFYQPVSKLTGGYGQILSSRLPLSGAKVSITDRAGTLSALTDTSGRFAVPVASKKVLFLAMANPMKHHVTVTIERNGSKLAQWRFIKAGLGPNYFDFGVIQAKPWPDNVFKPKPLPGSVRFSG